MKIKWLVFGIIVMVTSLMQAAIYKVTNVSPQMIKIGFMESAEDFGAVFKRIKPNEIVTLDKGNRKVGVLVIMDNIGTWYVEDEALHARIKEVVNIQVREYGYCDIERGKRVKRTRGILKSGFLGTTLEEEQAVQ